MRRSTYRVLAAVVGVACAGIAGATQAASVNTTLDTLVAGGSSASGLTVGDKHYSDFTFSSSGDAPVAANNVDVSLVSSDGDNHYQLRFTFARDQLDASANQTTDVVIGYKVEVLGTQLINRVGLAFDSSVTGSQAAASVIESVRTTDGSDLVLGDPVSDQENLSVFNDGSGGLGDNSSSSLAVNPTRSLQFEKDILVSSRPNGGRVIISTVDNTVDQVPEPTSLALVGIAGVGLLLRRRAR